MLRNLKGQNDIKKFFFSNKMFRHRSTIIHVNPGRHRVRLGDHNILFSRIYSQNLCALPRDWLGDKAATAKIAS